MGLDITAYRKLTPDPAAAVDEDGYPKDRRKHYRPGAALAWSEGIWPGRCPELTEGTIYGHAGSMDFRAGSYSGYNEFRSWLDRLENLEDEIAWREQPRFGGGAER